MLGTEGNGIVFTTMARIFAEKTMQEMRDKDKWTEADLAVFSFYDGMRRTSIGAMQVLEAKRTPSETLEMLSEYADNVRKELSGANNDGESEDQGRAALPRVDTAVHGAGEEPEPHAHVAGASPDDDGRHGDAD